MTIFDASEPAERRKLFAEGIAAHRQRSSPFTTFRGEPGAADAGEEADDDGPLEGTVEGLEAELSDDPDPDQPRGPWLQYAEREGLLNLDCTDDELARLKDLLDDYPSFRIDDLTRPEAAEGTNAKVSARADPKRIADFVDEAFQRVYGLDPDYRAWVVEI